MSMSKMCQIASLSNGEGSFKMKECAPLHASCEDMRCHGLPPFGDATDSGLPGPDRGRVGYHSLKVVVRAHSWFLHGESPKFGDICPQESEQ